MASLATRFRDLRVEAKLTKTALATPRYTGSYVTQIEAGKRTPSREAMAYFAQGLGVSTRFLSTGVPDGLDVQLGYRLENARLQLRTGEHEQAESALREVIQESERYDMLAVLARARSLLGDALSQAGRLREAIDVYEEAMEGELTERELGMTLVGLGAAYRGVGDLAYAAELLEEYLGRKHAAPLDRGVAVSLQAVLLGIYMERGDLHRAERVGRRALAQADDQTPLEARAGVYWNASQLYAELRRWDEALELAARARTLMEEIQDERNVARLHNNYAYLCLEVEPPRVAEASEHLDRASDLLSEVGRPGDLAYVNSERARLALVENQPQEALRHIELAIAEPAPQELEMPRYLLLKGRALSRMNRIEEAKSSLAEAASNFEKHGARREAAVSWRELGEIELASGNLEEAVEAMRTGLEILEPAHWHTTGAPEITDAVEPPDLGARDRRRE